MMNAATEHGHEPEDEEDRAHTGDVLGERVLVLLDERRAGDHLDVAVEHRLDGRHELPLVDSLVGGDGDRIGLTGRRQQLGRRRVGEEHCGRPGRESAAPNRAVPAMVNWRGLVLREHRHDVAGAVARSVGTRLVDDDLVVAGGCTTAREHVRVQVVDRHPVRPEGGVGRQVADGLAVGPDHLCVAVDAQRHLVDTGDRGHLGRECLVSRRGPGSP